MALVKVKPTSPGRRGVVKVTNPQLHKGEPHAPLVENRSSNGGRNNAGRITVRHRGGGHKQRYRVIDFKRDKDGVPARVNPGPGRDAALRRSGAPPRPSGGGAGLGADLLEHAPRLRALEPRDVVLIL